MLNACVFQMNVKVQSTLNNICDLYPEVILKRERVLLYTLIQDLRQAELGLFVPKIKYKSSFEMISNRENRSHQIAAKSKASLFFSPFLLSVYYCVLYFFHSLEVKNLLHDKSVYIYNEIINGNRYYKSIANS